MDIIEKLLWLVYEHTDKISTVRTNHFITEKERKKKDASAVVSS